MRSDLSGAESLVRRNKARRGQRLIAALTILLCCTVQPVQADDPRSTYLIKLLQGSSQFRVRAQAAISLGAIEGSSSVVVNALATALRDTHPAVRAAAATSLGRVGDTSVLAALRPLERDLEEPVRQAARSTIARLQSGPHAPEPSLTPTPVGPPLYYVQVAEPATRVTELDKRALAEARTFIRRRLGQIEGVRLAPDSETAQAAEQVLKAQRLKGYYLDSSIVSIEQKPGGETRAQVSIIVATYPGRDMRAIMKGAATVTGGGGQNTHQAVESALNGALRQFNPQLLRQ
jgi:hypothetical protein